MPNPPKKILIVEDDQFMASMLERALLPEGYEVRHGSSGAEAVALTADFQPDVVLLDIVLPDMDGFSILKKLRGGKPAVNCPVIILSNINQPQDLAHAKTLGVTRYLVKSNLGLDEVVREVASALQE